MNLNLKNKRVLITGGLTGIGLETAKVFIDEGAKVAISSRNQSKITLAKKYFKKKNLDVLIIQFNPEKKRDFNNFKNILDKQNFKLDILINNIGDGKSKTDIIPDNKVWDRTWNTNFKIPLAITKLFMNDIIKSNGVILFVASIVGLEVLNAPTDYTLAKSAVINLSKVMSKKLNGKARVNTVSPGNIIFKGGNWDKKIKTNKKIVNNYIKNNVPLKRFGRPEEIASSIVFLCSEKASFINGSNLVIDGGQTSLL